MFFGKDRDRLNELLVDTGLAWWDPAVDNVFDLNQQRARKAKRGLWRDPAPVPPWRFARPWMPRGRGRAHTA